MTDVVAALRLALARLRDPAVVGRAYNVGIGVGTPFDELAYLVRERAGMEGKIEVRVRETDEPLEQVVAVIDRARAELGYAPAVPLTEGLDRYLAWLRAQEPFAGQTPTAGAGR